jgi:hypothetical protein
MAQRPSLVRGGKPIQQDPTQCPPGLDTTTFFFPNIPVEIKATIPLFHSTPLEINVALLKAVMAYQEEEPSRFRLDPSLYAINPAVSVETINQILTALYYITRISIRNKIKLSVIRSDVSKMNVPKDLVEAICSEITAHRMAIESHIMTHRIQFHKLEKVRWRMDVVISSGSLSRVMRPNILMQVSYFPPTELGLSRIGWADF